jgi:hypothetical protein
MSPTLIRVLTFTLVSSVHTRFIVRSMNSVMFTGKCLAWLEYLHGNIVAMVTSIVLRLECQFP